MQHDLDKTWFDKALEQLQLGESLISERVDGLYHGWKASAEAIGKLCTGADRWHAMLREIQSTVNLADILRARTTP
jgi:carboxylesterase type B